MANHDNKSMGYLIPDNADPSDLNCILVFYPDDPLYLAALLGGITYLGTWTAWQRDPDKRARIAAQAWKRANECTLDSMSCITDLVNVLTEIRDAIANQTLSVNLGDLALDVTPLLPALTGIQTAIEEKECNCSCHGEEDMAITINNCNCCGGGGGTGSPGLPGPPDTLPPDTLPPDPIQAPPDWNNPPSQIGTYSTQDAQCAMANYLFVTWRNIALDMAGRAFTQANVANKLALYFPGMGGGAAWQFAGGLARLALFVLSYMVMIGSQVSDIAREIDQKANAIKCALLNPDYSPDQRLAAARVLIDTMGLAFAPRYVLKSLLGYIPINVVWDYGTISYAIPVLEDGGHFAAGCPPCIQIVDPNDITDPNFQLPVGYAWVKVPYTGNYSLQGVGSVRLVEGSMSVNGTMGQNTSWSGLDLKATINYPSLNGIIVGMWSDIKMTMSVTRGGGWFGWENWLQTGTGRFLTPYDGIVAGTREFTQFLAWNTSGFTGENLLVADIGATANKYHTTGNQPATSHPLWLQLAYSIDWPLLSLDFDAKTHFLIRLNP